MRFYLSLFLILFVLGVVAPINTYAQTASTALESSISADGEAKKKTDTEIDAETKKRIDALIKELDGKTSLNIDAMEMLRKGGHVDTLEWIAAELDKKDGLRFIENEDAIANYVKTMDHLIADDEYLGLYYLRQSGFDDRVWKGYTKKTLQEHIDDLVKRNNLPYAFLDQLRLILLSKAKHPKGFNKDNFATWRVKTLLDFGFRQEALSFYTYLSLYYETENKQIDRDLLALGLTSYLINRKFDGACLEYSVHEDSIETLIKEQDTASLFTTVKNLCDIYMADEPISTPSTYILKDYMDDNIIVALPFMFDLASQGSIAITFEGVSFKSLSLSLYIKLAGLLEASNMPRLDKKVIFTALLDQNRLSVATLLRLFDQDDDFITWSNQTYYKQIQKTPSAFDKMALIEKQIIQNRTPHTPLSNLYYRFIHPIKPNDAFKDSAKFVSYYLYMNDSYSKARKWANINTDIPAEYRVKPSKNNSNPLYYEKNNSFFIFPLAYWSGIMLKPKDDVKTAVLSVSASLQHIRRYWLDMRDEQNIRNGEAPHSDAIETLFDKRLSSDNKRLVSQFEDAARSKEKAKTVIMSVLIWDEALDTVKKLAKEQQVDPKQDKEQEETLRRNDDLTEIVKFILHSLNKSDLNNYALAFGLDIASLKN